MITFRAKTFPGKGTLKMATEWQLLSLSIAQDWKPTLKEISEKVRGLSSFDLYFALPMPFYSYTLLLFGKLFLPLCSFCLGAHPVDRAEADNEARGERAAPRCEHDREPDHLEGGQLPLHQHQLHRHPWLWYQHGDHCQGHQISENKRANGTLININGAWHVIEEALLLLLLSNFCNQTWPSR